MPDEQPAQLSAGEAARAHPRRPADFGRTGTGLPRAQSARSSRRSKRGSFSTRKHALEQARAADERKRSGEPIGPLNGIPVGIKDIIDTADMPTENGTVLAQRSHPALRMRRWWRSCARPAR